MTPEEFAQYLAIGYEGHGYEFKGAWPKTDPVFFAKVARAALAMSNRADGGLVFIGVDEDAGGSPIPTGLDDAMLATWKHDDIAAALAPIADPNIVFDDEVIEYEYQATVRKILVLHIHEFENIPVICRKDVSTLGPAPAKKILRDGAIYVRTRKKPESSEPPTQTEMRELIDLATDKALRKFLARAKRAGLAVPEETGAEVGQFAAQLESFDEPAD